MSCILCHVEDPLHRAAPWSVIPAQVRAEGSHHHLWLVPDAHVGDLLDLDPEVLAAFWPVLRWTRDTFGPAAYGLAVNTGGHVYAQVITGEADRTVHVEVRHEHEETVNV